MLKPFHGGAGVVKVWAAFHMSTCLIITVIIIRRSGINPISPTVKDRD